MSAKRANPRLMALQRTVLAERQRRGDEGYNDEHVKRLAIHLTLEEIDLENLSAAESFAMSPAIGLSVDEYIATVEWLNPEHAEMLRRTRQ
jgi:hypothetical protein